MKGKNWLLNAWVCLWYSFGSTIELFKTHLWSFALNWSSSTITQSIWMTMESIIGILRDTPAFFDFESNLKLFLFRNLGSCYSQWLKAIQLRNLFFLQDCLSNWNARVPRKMRHIDSIVTFGTFPCSVALNALY